MGLRGIRYKDVADRFKIEHEKGNLDEDDLLDIGEFIVDLSQKDLWCNKYGTWCKHVEEQHYEDEIDCDLDCNLMCKHCERVEY